MATSIFITWAALRDKLKDNIADFANSNEFKAKSYTQPDGVTITYSDIGSMLRDLAKVEALAAVDADTYDRPKYGPITIRHARD